MTLVCMSFLWIGSQIPLYLFGSVLPLIYQDVGGVDRYTWFVIGYLIPNAALCPFVGALSDLFGRRNVAIVGQVCLIVGPIITATANTMNIAIGKKCAPNSRAELLIIHSWKRFLWHRRRSQRTHCARWNGRGGSRQRPWQIRRLGGFHYPSLLPLCALCSDDCEAKQLAIQRYLGRSMELYWSFALRLRLQGPIPPYRGVHCTPRPTTGRLHWWVP
jgi:hypothetical protein